MHSEYLFHESLIKVWCKSVFLLLIKLVFVPVISLFVPVISLKDYEERLIAILHFYKSIGFNHKHLFES